MRQIMGFVHDTEDSMLGKRENAGNRVAASIFSFSHIPFFF